MTDFWYNSYKLQTTKTRRFAGIIGRSESTIEYAIKALRGEKSYIYTNEEIADMLEVKLKSIEEEFRAANEGKELEVSVS